MTGGLFRNSIFSALTAASTALAGFFSIVIVARMLGPSETGLVVYVLWLVTLTVTIFDLGFHSTVARFLPEMTARHDEGYARGVLGFLLRPYLAFCGLALLAAVLILEMSGRIAGRGLLLAAIALCIAQLLANAGLGCLRGFKQFDLSARLNLASAACQILGVLIGSHFFGVPGALAGMSFGSLAIASTLFPYLVAPLLRDKLLLRRLVRFAAYTWLGNIAALFVWNRAEVMFLEHSWGTHAVGLYSVGLTFANLAVQGPMLLSGALLAFFSERVALDAMDSVQEAFATGTRIMAFLVFPLCFGAAAILPVLLPLLYGKAFVASVPSATIVVLSAAIGAPGVVGTNMMYARDRSDFIFVSTLIGAILFLAVGFIVIPSFGMIGAALGRFGVQSAMVFMGCRFIATTLNCSIPYKDLLRLLAAAATCAIVARLCIALVTGVTGLTIAIPAGAVTYALMVRFLRALPAADMERLQLIGARFPEPMRWLPTTALRILAPSHNT